MYSELHVKLNNNVSWIQIILLLATCRNNKTTLLGPLNALLTLKLSRLRSSGKETSFLWQAFSLLIAQGMQSLLKSDVIQRFLY